MTNGYKRFVLMGVFQCLLEGNLPAGTTRLDEEAVKAYSVELYRLDGEIIYNLAVNFTKVNQSLTCDQKAQLMAMQQELLGDLSYPSGAYLYSQAIPMPEIP